MKIYLFGNSSFLSLISQLLRLPLIIAFLFLTSASLRAEILNVTAEFKPTASNPRVDKFTNTTPVAGFCEKYGSYCGEGVFSLATGLKVTNKHLIAGSTNNDERTFQSLDAAWKTLTLTDSTTGESIEVQFRLMMISQRYTRVGGGFVLADFNTAGRAPQGGCVGTMGASLSTYYLFGWIHTSNPTNCYKNVLNMNFTDVTIDTISVGYEMTSTSPMNMPNGTYEGEVIYTVGKGSQIDLGAGDYEDNSLTIKIKADIEHELRFEMEGSSKVAMLPPGGWDSWTSGSSSQFTLEGTGKFRTTASAPFSVHLECQHQILNNCALQKEGDDTLVQVDTVITLPFIIERASGEEVWERPIYIRSPHTPEYVFEPRSYVSSYLSSVKFKVNQIESLRMGQYPGSTWRGSATLIFDAEISSP